MPYFIRCYIVCVTEEASLKKKNKINIPDGNHVQSRRRENLKSHPTYTIAFILFQIIS
jgi:hypothetical protein